MEFKFYTLVCRAVCKWIRRLHLQIEQSSFLGDPGICHCLFRVELLTLDANACSSLQLDLQELIT